MDTLEFTKFQEKWRELVKKLADDFGEEPDLQAILFLIGVQELGKGAQDFSKDEKQDLMHIATCKVLSAFGYYKLNGNDTDGWPRWQIDKQLPIMSLKEQDILLKQAVLYYFDKEGLIL